MPTTQPFYTSKQFATLVGKNERTINNILTSKKSADNSRRSQLPPFKRVAGKYIITTRDFEMWLAEQPAVNTPICSTRGRPRGTTKTQK